MGMRAVFAFENTKNEKIVTSVQWSTFIHKNLPVVVHYIMEKFNLNFDEAVTKIFTEHISPYVHIGEFNISSQKDIDACPKYYNNIIENFIIGRFNRNEDGMCHFIYANGYFNKEEEEIHTDDMKLKTIVKKHWHAQDGISMYYKQGSGKVEYYIDKKHEYVNQEDLTPLTAENVKERALDSTGEITIL